MLSVAVVVGLGCASDDGNTGRENIAEVALALCTPADCDDGNDCTSDACISGSCTHTPKALPAECSDGDACTRNDRCDEFGVCWSGPTDGSDGNPCTIDSCDPMTGRISTPVPAGTWCTDENTCTIGDQCDGGGHCLGAPLAVGTGCDDGNDCTASDQCDAGGTCVGAPVINGTPCDGNECWLDECTNGVCFRVTAEPDGTACDYAKCVSGEACSDGFCLGGTQLSVGTPCSDGNACNGADTCDNSATCQPGTSVLVGDGQPCSLDLCDPGTGAITHQTASAGAPCSDGDLCNGTETCDGIGPGSASCLAGTPPTVDDSNPCTIDTCDPVAGVKHKGCSPIDRTVATTIDSASSFLYDGIDPPQKVPDPLVFDPKRVAVIRGNVSTSAGAALSGVTIKVVGQPQ